MLKYKVPHYTAEKHTDIQKVVFLYFWSENRFYVFAETILLFSRAFFHIAKLNNMTICAFKTLKAHFPTLHSNLLSLNNESKSWFNTSSSHLDKTEGFYPEGRQNTEKWASRRFASFCAKLSDLILSSPRDLMFLWDMTGFFSKWSFALRELTKWK